MTIPQAFDLATKHHQAGRLGEAEALYRQILGVQPNHADAVHYLGVIAYQAGRNDLAVERIRQAIALDPNDPDAYSNLGLACCALGQFDEAMAMFRRALDLKPDLPEAHVNLGNALYELGRLDDAMAAFRGALAFQPDHPDAHYNLGNALVECGRIDEGVAAYRRALEFKPDYAQAHTNLGNALKEQGALDEALAAYRRALEVQPGHPRMHSNLIYALYFHPADDERAIAEERGRWNRRFADPLKQAIRPHARDRDPERRLRIGYVSPDFREHAVGRYLLPLFRCHDRRNFEILCYSDVLRADRLTEEFRRHSFQWRSAVGVSDEALAEIIRQDGVDILVDLTQHMAGNRLPTFARKPAPLQCSFAGYPDGAGLETIEHRISDRYLEMRSPDEKIASAERVSLIESFYCYDPCGLEVEVNPLPARGGAVTFGSLNNFAKVNKRTLSLWARVLANVTDSRLMISSRHGAHRERTLATLERAGVEAGRVEFVDFRPRRQYLELYHQLDIALDTFPYNGGVTSCDALWMGVPVVSLAGRTPVSRAGLSLLTNLGLPEFATRSEIEFVRIAKDLANDLPRLAGLRAALRQKMLASPLMDAPRFAQNIEAAYRSMWRRWCEGPSPRSDKSDESDESDPFDRSAI